MDKYCLVITETGEAASAMSFLKLGNDDVVALVVGAQELAEEVTRSVMSVKWINTNGTAAENYINCAAEAVNALSPTAVVGVASAASRAIIGYVAAMTDAPLVPNLVKISDNGDTLCVEHAIYSDKMIETLEAPHGACMLVNPFSLQPVEPEGEADLSRIAALDAQGITSVEILSSETLSASHLQSADIVVGVGMGCSSEGAFAAAKELAEKLGAELGCSMPVYGELALLPHERYIGVSGLKIAPKLYIALGISGTSQHCAGVRNAKNIVCINKDPKALFFDNADYGIVGDLNEVLPQLIAELK